MKTAKKIGIWMDHTIAYLIEFTSDAFETKTIESEFSKEDKAKALAKSESLMHNKENQELSSFYKKIAEIIQDYDEVLLFGPTNAKVELFDILRKDEKYGKIQFEIINTDKMTENQKTAFVKDYFLEV
jgi:hypothetical protein